MPHEPLDTVLQASPYPYQNAPPQADSMSPMPGSIDETADVLLKALGALSVAQESEAPQHVLDELTEAARMACGALESATAGGRGPLPARR